MGSNNTPELQAILEALLLLPFLPAHTSAITLHTDSKYAYDLLLGLAIPSANPQLANLLLSHFYPYHLPNARCRGKSKRTFWKFRK